jgi:peptidoglycan/LPS O-acetylase OafA/YrhL
VLRIKGAEMAELVQLTGLRGLAAMEVTVWHASGFFQANLLGETDGELGVMIFFQLSGFLMGYLYFNTPCTPARAAKFLLVRAARVVPLYCMGIAVAAAYHFQGQHLWFMLRAGLNPTWQGTAVNAKLAHLWTVKVELIYYGVFLLCWAVRYSLPRTFNAIAVVVVAVYIAAYFDFAESGAIWRQLQMPFPNYIRQESRFCCCFTGPGCAFAYMPVFLFGSFLGATWERGFKPILLRVPFTVNVVGALALVFGVLLNTMVMRNRLGIIPDWHMISLGGSYHTNWPGGKKAYLHTFLNQYNWVMVSALLLCAAAGPNSLGFLASAPLRWIGEVSYGIYVYHLFLFLFVRDAFEVAPYAPVSLVNMAGLTATMALLFFISWLSFRFFEAPLLAYVRRFGDGLSVPAQPKSTAVPTTLQ